MPLLDGVLTEVVQPSELSNNVICTIRLPVLGVVVKVSLLSLPNPPLARPQAAGQAQEPADLRVPCGHCLP